MITSLVYFYVHNNAPDYQTSTVLAKELEIIEVDFDSKATNGSPLVFGGAQTPEITDQAGWDAIADAGVTVIRKGFLIENILQGDITVESYKNNVSNIQDPSNWNLNSIEHIKNVYQNAKNRNIKVIGVVAYMPEWLGYSGKYSIPSDWGVFFDIVKKTYRIYRPYIDYIEIWNEPDNKNFFNINNSKLSRHEAYTKMFSVAAEAIRSVDKEENDNRLIPIIGPAAAQPEKTDILDHLITNVPSTLLNGISLHSYDKDEPSWYTFKKVLERENLDLPIFIDEWNESSEYKANPYIYSNLAIPYTGTKLISFLKGGVAAANYYSMSLYDPYNPIKNEDVFGFYVRRNDKVELLPQGKTWKLLSVTLALGKGQSEIYQTNSDNTPSLGFVNMKGERGIIISNEKSTKEVLINLKNLPDSGTSTIKAYQASSESDGQSLTCSKSVSVRDGAVQFTVQVPENSVVGIVIEPLKINVETIKNVLGLTTKVDCIIK